MADIYGPASSLNAVTARPSDGRAFSQTDSWFKDCTTPSSQDGTQVVAAWLNQVTAVLRLLARANGVKLDGVTPVVPYDQTDGMALEGVEHLIQRGRLNFAADAGVANSLQVTLPVVPAELVDGFQIVVHVAATNTTASPAITLLGFSAVPFPIVRQDGSAPAAGDLLGGSFAALRYHLATGAFRATGLLKSDTAATIASGEGVAIASGLASLNLPALIEEDTVSGADIVVFYAVAAEGGQAAGHHYRTTFANLAAAVLSYILPTAVLQAQQHDFTLSADTSYPNNVNTVMPFQTATAGFGTCSAGVVTITEAGLYTVSYNITGTLVMGSAGTAGFGSYLLFTIGGVTTRSALQNITAGPSTNLPVVQSSAANRFMNPGDKVQLYLNILPSQSFVSATAYANETILSILKAK